MPDSESVPSLPPAVPAKMATGARHTTFSILGSDVVVTGNVAASVDLHVDGKLSHRRHGAAAAKAPPPLEVVGNKSAAL